MTKVGPTNYIFDGDPKLKADAPLYFVCKKCKEKIWKHLYNEHIHNCPGKRAVIKQTKSTILKKKPNKKIKINIFGSSRSKHRRNTKR